MALPWPCGLGLRFQWSLPPHRRGCEASARLHPTLAVQNQPEALWLDPVSLATEPRPNFHWPVLIIFAIAASELES